MMLLARRLGHVQLAQAVRFTAEWEQQASLRLRAGDISALDAYDGHGRIRGGEPDQIMDQARKMYVGHYLAGTDVELIVWERERCREMSRRDREDLIHLGQVERGRKVGLAQGARGIGWRPDHLPQKRSQPRGRNGPQAPFERSNFPSDLEPPYGIEP